MPLYEYQCNSCNDEFELLRQRNTIDPLSCPACGSREVERVMSAFCGRIASNSGSSPTRTGGSACSSCSATSCRSCRI